ncbi:putative glycolipid-binding domain-containing protein [Paenibacillus thiaminolyticus]|nr:putative glycolipid-binding domain-containing protein [Paenibacillus thiaminolyticus]MEC0063250.1 putative glycolipid-binding domain-containing protein [Paenibacillus thiaminolyticus]MEC0103542.1 putative glycolipid-binding domain-containing protein [Paenibacillus thiaminolyticus]
MKKTMIWNRLQGDGMETARLEVDENGMILAYEDQWASL